MLCPSFVRCLFLVCSTLVGWSEGCVVCQYLLFIGRICVVLFVLFRIGEDVINIHVAAATTLEPPSLATNHRSAGLDRQWVQLKREIESQQTLIRTSVA